MLKEIERVDLAAFNETYPFKRTIQTNKSELQEAIQAGDLHYIWLPACPRANRITSVFKWYAFDEYIQEHQLSPFYKMGSNWQFASTTGPFSQTSIQDYFPEDVRGTQPFLYDAKNKRVISNDTYHMSMLLAELADEQKDLEAEGSLFPKEQRTMLRKWNAWLYENVNKKIYQVAAFIGEDKAEGIAELEDAYEKLNTFLAANTYLQAEQLTETDLRLFHNLIRHQIYFKQFQVFTKPLAEFVHLENYVLRIIELHPEIVNDVYFDEIRKTHFRSEHNINKYGFVKEIPTNTEVFPFSLSIKNKGER